MSKWEEQDRRQQVERWIRANQDVIREWKGEDWVQQMEKRGHSLGWAAATGYGTSYGTEHGPQFGPICVHCRKRFHRRMAWVCPIGPDAGIEWPKEHRLYKPGWKERRKQPWWRRWW